MLSQPLLIVNAMTTWPIVDLLRRRSLLDNHAATDVLVSSIPYGDLFGVRAGYATLAEFVAYMDDLRVQNFSLSNSTPLYVFDSDFVNKV
jgi:hypothetical protein